MLVENVGRKESDTVDRVTFDEVQFVLLDVYRSVSGTSQLPASACIQASDLRLIVG